ncbi:hypothetical protein F4678DRAFT_443716 [Xylaria arbuscula]|nr:hypothetical protein F4678DRAFT_443716 [Xylaria arbuscula]
MESFVVSALVAVCQARSIQATYATTVVPETQRNRRPHSNKTKVLLNEGRVNGHLCDGRGCVQCGERHKWRGGRRRLSLICGSLVVTKGRTITRKE